MGKIKVLLIEDALLIRERLVSALEKFGETIEISYATKMPEAFVAFIDHKPDIIVLDISIQDGNGIWILEKVKKTNPNIIVIVFTNFPFPQVKKKCLKLGADYFFSKENEFRELISTFELIIHEKKVNTENHVDENNLKEN